MCGKTSNPTQTVRNLATSQLRFIFMPGGEIIIPNKLSPLFSAVANQLIRMRSSGNQPIECEEARAPLDGGALSRRSEHSAISSTGSGSFARRIFEATVLFFQVATRVFGAQTGGFLAVWANDKPASRQRSWWNFRLGIFSDDCDVCRFLRISELR